MVPGRRSSPDAQVEEKLRELVDIQASLRRLAMLVARGEPPEAVFTAVTKEALRHFGGGTARMIRFELDGTVTLVANEGTAGPPRARRRTLEGLPAAGLAATIRRTERAARVGSMTTAISHVRSPIWAKACGPRLRCRFTSIAGCGEQSLSDQRMGRCRPIPSSG